MRNRASAVRGRSGSAQTPLNDRPSKTRLSRANATLNLLVLAQAAVCRASFVVLTIAWLTPVSSKAGVATDRILNTSSQSNTRYPSSIVPVEKPIVTSQDQTAATAPVTTSSPALGLSPSSNSSPGCGKQDQKTGALELTISDGKIPNRSYKLKVPTNYNPRVPLPIVMVFHGLGGTSDAAIGFGIQSAAGALQSAIFVYPQASVYTGPDVQAAGQVGWFDQCGSVDMTFVKNILASVEANYCVDQNRVFAAGFSWGCDFVTALNCCEGKLLRGISAASCTDEYSKGVVADIKDPNYYLNYDNLDAAGVCRGNPHAAIRFAHDSSGGDTAYAVPSFTQTSSLYRSMNSCLNTATAVDPTTSATVNSSVCASFDHCTNPVVECSYRKLGHTLPANWGRDTWQFFSAFK